MSLIPPLNHDEVQEHIDRITSTDRGPVDTLRRIGQPTPTDEQLQEVSRLVQEGSTAMEDLSDELREAVEAGGVLLKGTEYARNVLDNNPMLAMIAPEIAAKLAHGFTMGFAVAVQAAQDAADGREQMGDEIEEFLAGLNITSEEDER